MSDVVNFPGTTPLFEVDPEMFDRIARVTPAPFGRILVNRSLDLVDTQRYRAVDAPLVIRQFAPLILESMKFLESDLLEFDYDKRPALPRKVQRSGRWHFDSKAGGLIIGSTPDYEIQNAIVGMTVLPTMVASGELPEDQELIKVLNVRPRNPRGVIQDAAQQAVDAEELQIEYAKVGWGSLLPGDAMHKGQPNLSEEPIPRGFFRVKEV